MIVNNICFFETRIHRQYRKRRTVREMLLATLVMLLLMLVMGLAGGLDTDEVRHGNYHRIHRTM